MAGNKVIDIVVLENTQIYWDTNNPILSLDQAAYSTDTKIMKKGDGIKTYSELPIFNYIDTISPHSNIHSAGGRDEITPEMIGASPNTHLHTPAEIGASPVGHIHTPEEIGAVSSEALANLITELDSNKFTINVTIDANTNQDFVLPETITILLEYLSIDIKFRDIDNKLYAATAVAYYSLDLTTRTLTIFNTHTTSLEFFISLK